MAALPDTIRPGDVISSDLMVRLIALVNAHEVALGGVAAGGITVPDLFGRNLAEARVALQLQRLVLGTVIDAFGAIVSSATSATSSVAVLNQVPAAGARTVAGAAVNLVVAAQNSTTPAPPPVPVLNLIVPTAARVGDTVEMRGSGFAGASSRVTFGGIAGTVLGTSSQTVLFVTVPAGIPGAPTTSSAPDVTGIAVRINNASGNFAESSITLRAPLATPLLITALTPKPAMVGKPLTVSGSGFAPAANQNVVRFGAIAATPTTVSATQMIVTVPSGIPGLITPGDSTTVNLSVQRNTDQATSGSLPLDIDL